MSHAKFAMVALTLGVASIIGWRLWSDQVQDQGQLSASDARNIKATLSIGVDGWVGYFPLCSPEMKKRLYHLGYGLNCVDDAADYQQRFAKLKKNEYHFAVATVDSYLLNGESHNYPGPIVSVIDESKGGDAIVSWKDRIASLDALKESGPTTDALKIAFTPDSPSHHLLKSVSTHFDLKALQNTRRHVHTDGSEAAFKRFKNRDVDAAVIWEPEVSKALENDEVVRLLGTEETQQLIVDILIVSQEVAQNDPDLVMSVLKTYFRTLKHYQDQPDRLIEDISDHYDISKATAKSLLKGVAWANLSANAEYWFNLSTGSYSPDALFNSIESALEVLMDHGDFKRNPLPDSNPYRLLNSDFVGRLYNEFERGRFGSKESQTQQTFAQLTPQEWSRLQPVGSLKTRRIAFASGTSELTLEGKQQIDALASDLKHYPRFRVEVRGHTGLRGDAQANKALSEQRAGSVLHYLQNQHRMSNGRARALGLGSDQPLKRLSGESNRAYNYRLPRVEIVLVRETI